VCQVDALRDTKPVANKSTLMFVDKAKFIAAKQDKKALIYKANLAKRSKGFFVCSH
jgi:hypothetical protein